MSFRAFRRTVEMRKPFGVLAEGLFLSFQSGRADLNRRPLAPQFPKRVPRIKPFFGEYRQFSVPSEYCKVLQKLSENMRLSR
jgi:hypothetical protein